MKLYGTNNYGILFQVCVVGVFPPPVHGLSLCNEAIRKRLIELGFQPLVINLSPKSLDRSLSVRLLRVKKVIKGIGTYARNLLLNRCGTLYMGVSGGYGQLYEITFAALARLFGRRIFLHYQSYACIAERKYITSILTRISGPKAVHIVLCEAMGHRLKDLYNSVHRVLVLSNAALITPTECRMNESRNCMRTIGFLSNISLDKGILEFFEVLDCLENGKSKIKALIAGPFQDKNIEAIVMKRLSGLKTAHYVGPKYGEEKAKFFKSIDVLLFPTKYFNEAEPFTIYEAISYGAPVIAWERGCIADMITSDVGIVIGQGQAFVCRSVEQLMFWYNSPSSFSRASSSAAAHFFTLKTESAKNLERLLSMMVGFIK